MKISKTQLDQLRELESEANDGRGVTCVRSIIFYIETGDFESAAIRYRTDRDKLRQYPELEAFLKDLFSVPCFRCKGSGLNPKQHPHRYTGGGKEEPVPCDICFGDGVLT
jgi:hypothetical protein